MSLAWHKLSFLGDIFDKDTCNWYCTTNRDLYLIIIFVKAENTVSHKYVVAQKVAAFWQTFETTKDTQKPNLAKILGVVAFFKLNFYRCVQISYKFVLLSLIR